MSGAVQVMGHLPGGRAVETIALSGGALRVRILTLGAILQDVRLDGVDHGLTLGAPDLAAYLGPLAHFGAVIGPVANRIKGAEAMIGGARYRFEDNMGGATLHSGRAGTQFELWRIVERGEAHVSLAIDLAHGDGGFPGNRRITARYAIEAPSTLRLDIGAETDHLTAMNIAHHGYWTMDGGADWSGQSLSIDAEHYLPMSPENLPTGEIAPVAGTRFDYRDPVRLDPQKTGRIDHNFCLARARRPAPVPALRLTGRSGVSLRIDTTEPGIQVFDMAPLDSEDFATLHGPPYGNRAGLAFEPQLWPGALHHPDFPSLLLTPGTSYAQQTRFVFEAPRTGPRTGSRTDP
ncbi:aldose epimerase family protein [Profundibacterium mesophilum]|uniref:Aldose 1-epimerase protein n=1 Tax=Profundibacterium mesophilum KAUST100406-0324 TaxID=1037889 RepID=A0A921TDQ0_9RHOB|nr:aldose epimerase family protein [Profundibacterium mesophilum]KAF0674564.1 putative aldose 1-epimerase protein [Profundibacterium mesophilum KAUST100406-0324]